MIGAVISDRLLGKYRTILGLSIVYACGSFLLALAAHSVWGVWAGLGLVAIGSGGIKPCVSAHVGDQFGTRNWFRLRTIFQAFYFIINFGSFFAYLLIPWIWEVLGVRVAFGIPGVLMVVATSCSGRGATSSFTSRRARADAWACSTGRARSPSSSRSGTCSSRETSPGR